MGLEIGFRGQVFDNAAPLYVDLGNGEVFDRIKRQRLNKASLVAAMAAEEYTPKTGELVADADWMENNTDSWTHVDAIAPVIAGLPAAADGGEATVTLDGRKLAAPVTLDVTFKLGANADVEFEVEVPAGADGNDVLTLIAAAEEWATNDQTPVVDGVVMTVTNGDADDDLVVLTIA